jgi:hypothetical protein
MCAINLSVEAKYIGFARQQTYLTEALQSMTPNPNAGGTPKGSVNSDPTEYNFLVQLVKDLPKYQMSIHGIDAEDHSDNWNTYSKTYTQVAAYDTFLARCGFVGDPEQAKIYQELRKGDYSITIKHRPWFKVWRSYATEAEKITAQNSGITRSFQNPGLGEPYNSSANSPKRDVQVLQFNGTEAVITDATSWKNLARYGGGGATEDSRYDNVVNVVWRGAKGSNPSISKYEARNLYLDNMPDDKISNVANATKLQIEYGLDLEVTLSSSKTASKPNTIYMLNKGTLLTSGNGKSGFIIEIKDSEVK